MGGFLEPTDIVRTPLPVSEIFTRRSTSRPRRGGRSTRRQRGASTPPSATGNYGNLVEVDHGFDLTTRYGHLAEFAVSVGDTVQRGDVIGYVGATGRATGYHVHYEVRTANRTIDPMRLIARSDTASAN